MVPDVVIDRQISREPLGPLLQVLEGHGLSPLPAEGLDQSIGLAVGTGRVGPGANVTELQGLASVGELVGNAGRPLVAHHSLARDPLAVEPGDGAAQKAHHGGLLLDGEDFDIGQPSVPSSTEYAPCRSRGLRSLRKNHLKRRVSPSSAVGSFRSHLWATGCSCRHHGGLEQVAQGSEIVGDCVQVKAALTFTWP